jgi:hypothetical protein
MKKNPPSALELFADPGHRAATLRAEIAALENRRRVVIEEIVEAERRLLEVQTRLRSHGDATKDEACPGSSCQRPREA